MRHTIAMCVIAGVALLATVNFGSAGEVRRWQGTQNGTTEPRTLIATTKAEWRALWAALSMPAPEDFDDERHVGVAIFLGRRGSEGYAVRIASMAPRKDQFVIEVDEVTPGTGSTASQTPTTPWLVLLIDRPDLPIVIEPRFRTQRQ